jgi:ABC-2 type transport system ATP-binding protein
MDVVRNESGIKAGIGLAGSDDRSFYWRLTGRQNLRFFASLYGLSNIQAITRIRELSDLFGLAGLDKRFQQYSSGMKQKLSLIRALIHDPQVLFLDEPTRSLDPDAARGVRSIIKDILVRQQGKTVFFSTHNLEEAEYLSDRVAIMDGGHLRLLEHVDELRSSTENTFVTLKDIFNRFVK